MWLILTHTLTLLSYYHLILGQIGLGSEQDIAPTIGSPIDVLRHHYNLTFLDWTVSGTQTLGTRTYSLLMWSLRCTMLADIVLSSGAETISVAEVSCRFRLDTTTMYLTSERTPRTTGWLVWKCLYNWKSNDWSTPKEKSNVFDWLPRLNASSSTPELTICLSSSFNQRNPNFVTALSRG